MSEIHFLIPYEDAPLLASRRGRKRACARGWRRIINEPSRVRHRSNFAMEIALDIDHCFPEAIGVLDVSVVVKITDVQ